MAEYQVKIRETLEKTVTVEADNAAQAKEIVNGAWKIGEYILDADHFKGVTFSLARRSERER